MIERLTADRLRTWLVSGLVGGAAVPLIWVAGLLGLLLVVAWLALFVWLGRARVIALSGLLSGFGFVWLGYLFVMYSMARVPELPLWLATGLGSLGVGIGLLFAAENVAAADARGSGRLHGMGREESISYFRDVSGKGRAPGVQEEDIGRWGSGRGLSEQC